MIIKTHNAFFRLREVYAIKVGAKTERVITKPWSIKTFWRLPETKNVKTWQLCMTYLGEDDVKHKVFWGNAERKELIKLMESIVAQVRAQDHEIADRAFEDAVANLEKK